MMGFISVVAAAEPVDFVRDIRPILAANCYACHGADEGSREAGLRLDQRAAAIAMHDGVQSIVPGKSAASEAVLRIQSDDPDLRMPPPDAERTLTADQVALIKRWIDQGAPYAEHWSFRKPQPYAPPRVRQNDWVRNDVDRFLLARLEAAKLAPNPAADRYALIRRLSLDLTGLPPTIEEADAFVADHSPEAYAKVVDRLLSSSAYGEHWARIWLDLARYADTKGYEKDQPRNIWRYRDWVIEALNADMPYDQFTRQQLAGDLLPEPTMQQRLATAFHRNTMTNDEGGTDNEEFRIAAVKDRVDTTMQVWMGLTMGCAKCHSHKYDPITHQEYYEFFAAFNQTEDADRGDDAPRLATPTTEQQDQAAELQAERKAAQTRLDEAVAGLTEALREWENQQASAAGWKAIQPETSTSEGGATLKVKDDLSVLVSGKSPEKDIYTLLAPFPLKRITALRLEALTDPSLGKNGPGRNGAGPNFVVSELEAHMLADGKEIPLGLIRPQADFSQQGWNVVAAVDGKPETGWAIAPAMSQPHVAVFSLLFPVTPPEGAKLRIRISQQYGRSFTLGRFRISLSDKDPMKLKPALQAYAEVASIPVEKRTAAQQQQLTDAFTATHPQTVKLKQQVDAIAKKEKALAAAFPTTPVMQELPAKRQRTTQIHVRGNFLDPGDKVEPGLPAAFDHVTPRSVDRLAIAQWIVHPDNPLTARVAVNRVWARIFGVGLVETEEDFGTQGMAPSHPELLDWLALHFQQEQKWSLKELCKLIVMSAAYRQDSRVTTEALQIDPENRLIGRAPRYRLAAETVRDQALAASGLLSSKLGGPSVMPPQPPGIWRATYSKLQWKTSDGEDRYRRALYTFWRRTSPYPSMITFDAGSREVCTVRRVRTNTPLQALVSMNDPAYVEAAAALATRMLSGSSDSARVEQGFRLVLVRPPTKKESQRLIDLLESVRQEFKSDDAAAADLIKSANATPPAGVDPAEFAAWTVVGNVLLNLDETMMRN